MYPTIIDIRIAIADAKPLNSTCPKTATISVIRNTATNFGSIAVYESVVTMPPF